MRTERRLRFNEKMAINLRDHQLKALGKMKNGCILCGGTGSGKSITGLAYYFIQNGGQIGENYSRMYDKPKDLYIITTARKRDTHEWDKELGFFLLNTERELNDYENTVIIDSWNNIKKYSNVTDAFFLFDEDRITGNGVWTRSFVKLTKNNEWIILSATPGDKWSDYIPVFIANGFYRNRTQFLNEHVVYSRMYSYKIDAYLNEEKLIKLRNNILVPMEFERKTVQHHQDVYFDYDSYAYKQLIRFRADLKTGEPIDNAPKLCYELRKIANSGPGRKEKAIEIVKKCKKVIIFYNFDYELSMLHEIFDPMIGEDGFLIGEWNGHIHQEVPTNKYWVYFVQYTSGSEGWNCISTNTIIFFSQTYSYKALIQATGRIDRLNTKYIDLYYYHFKTRSSIDLAISRTLSTKKEFNATNFVGSLYKK